MKIAIIGVGNLGLSIAKGLLISDKITSLYLTKNKISTIEEYNEIESNKPDPVIKSFFERGKKFWRNS